MDPYAVGVLLISVVFIFLFSGMPIAFAMGVPSLIVAFFFLDISHLNLTALFVYDAVDNFGLLAVPLFILMGVIVAISPCGADLYEGLNRWLHKLPGGLGASTVVACAIFAALCGSSPATAAAIGTMGIPEMRRRGYPNGLATGCIMGGGALGHLIPPGIIPIVYGIITGTSVGKIYIASVFPGIVVTLMMVVYVVFYSYYLRRRAFKHLDPSMTIPDSEFYSTTHFTWKERFAGLKKILPFLSIIILLLYVLFGGYATPSEAAGVAVLATLIMVLVIYGMTFETFEQIMKLTVKQTTMIMLIVAISALFSVLLTKLYITQTLISAFVELKMHKWVLMAMINLLFLIGGMFMPPVALLLICCPILHPIILAYGFDPVWFGVILSINLEVAMLTPPFGMNIFVVKGITPDIPVQTIIMGSIPFIICLLLGIVILSFLPELALWLPSKMITR